MDITKTQEEIYDLLLSLNIKTKHGIILGAGFDSNNQMYKSVMFTTGETTLTIHIYINGDITYLKSRREDVKKVNSIQELEKLFKSL